MAGRGTGGYRCTVPAAPASPSAASRPAGPDPGWRRLPLAVQLGVLLGVLAVSGSLLLRAVDRRHAAEAQELTARAEALADLVVVATALGNAIVDEETGKRGFMLSGDPAFLEPYERGERRETLTASAAVRRPLREVRRLLQYWRDSSAVPDLEWRRATPSALGTAELAPRVARGKQLMDSVRVAHAALVLALQVEGDAARAQRAAHAAASRAEITAVQATLIALVFIVVLGTVVVLGRNLDGVVHAAEALARGERVSTGDSPLSRAGSAEMRRLSAAYARLSGAIAEREDMLARDIERLREVERLKTEFVSTVSHELRTPLTSIRGSLGLVLADTAGEVAPKARDLLRIAHQNTERLIRLINDILDVEKMEAGHAEFRRDRVDLRTVLEMTLAGLEAYALEHRVRLALEGPPSAFVLGDPDRLVQVYTNLVSNAVKHSPPEAPVRVRFAPEDATAVVRVIDEGPGIPAAFQPRVFDKFQQAAPPGAKRSGTGLGLAIARKIVELHGGRIWFETAPDRGTTFFTALPLAPTRPALPTPEDGRPRVLIVEDDESMLAILDALVQPHAVPIVATSAEEGLAALRAGRVDAVILDPGLPGLSGYELVRRLRAVDRTHDLPVLLFTSTEPAADELTDLGIAPTHVFIKARQPESQLLRRLRAVLEARRT